ncbi:unnamed protein product [Rhizoctonia solani]|uniref:Uncharacterized protein n=1 Tax=Rhizoctonia solani TaxID=456999 RepID=A0A8H3DFF3_9AGAM|nr:unnamed protein product [Rhizoctonia solani]
MSFREKLHKLKSRAKSRISQTSQGNSGTTNQPSSTSASGASSRRTHFKTLVTALEQAAKPFPPLKAAISELAGSIANHDCMLSERKE